MPTVVFDEELYAQLNTMKAHHRDCYGHLVAKNQKLWDSIVVRNLTAKDFHLYEDGQEQRIQAAGLEPPLSGWWKTTSGNTRKRSGAEAEYGRIRSGRQQSRARGWRCCST